MKGVQEGEENANEEPPELVDDADDEMGEERVHEHRDEAPEAAEPENVGEAAPENNQPGQDEEAVLRIQTEMQIVEQQLREVNELISLLEQEPTCPSRKSES
ncbi:unnamed protein product [Heligmosomoides polygyrus]|uniref:GAGE domain-containing protein n=1 Tax=Heligmosomoides polygyrus TaxID=6339 RepID=A0A183GK42_HELPZ|nr:unnamed protein product [Heligmosomoides polygyrus]